jgi:hypothetical protein
MATTQLVNGLNKQDEGDLDWETDLNSGFDDNNTRTTLVEAGDPNSVGTPEVYWLGQICYDSTNTDIYVGTTLGVPPTGVWTPMEDLVKALGEALALTDIQTATITTTGAATLGGAVALNEDMTIATGKKIIAVETEAFLSDDNGSPDTMNPFDHQARHIQGGLDHIPGVVNAGLVTEASDTTGTDVGNVGSVAVATGLVNYSSRTNTSNALVFASCQVTQPTASTPFKATLQLQHQSNSGGWGIAGTHTSLDLNTPASLAGATSGACFGLQTAIPAVINQEWRLVCTVGSGGTLTNTRSQIMVVDLGEVS